MECATHALSPTRGEFSCDSRPNPAIVHDPIYATCEIDKPSQPCTCRKGQYSDCTTQTYTVPNAVSIVGGGGLSPDAWFGVPAVLDIGMTSKTDLSRRLSECLDAHVPLVSSGDAQKSIHWKCQPPQGSENPNRSPKGQWNWFCQGRDNEGSRFRDIEQASNSVRQSAANGAAVCYIDALVDMLNSEFNRQFQGLVSMQA